MQEQPRQSGQQRTYFVDNKQQQTSKDELSVQRILEKAGVQAEQEAGQQSLLTELRGDQRVEHRSLNEQIRIQDNARFETMKRGRSESTPGQTRPSSAQSGEGTSEGTTQEERPSGSPGPSDRTSDQ